MILVVKSLGFLECKGLVGAISAADQMTKMTSIHFDRIINSKGHGWVTVQISGELTAVKIAIQEVKKNLPTIYIDSAIIGNPTSGLARLSQAIIL